MCSAPRIFTPIISRVCHLTHFGAQIFDSKASQQDVYDAAVQPLVEEVMEGFNCTVFACTCVVWMTKRWNPCISKDRSDNLALTSIAIPILEFVFTSKPTTDPGQTGTGKTHTTEGALAEEDTARPEAGIIPRACNTVYRRPALR